MNLFHFSRFLFSFALLIFAATSLQAAVNFPFPQKKQYPYGNIFNGGDASKIQKQFTTWKGAWYKDLNNGTAYVISPNDSTEIAVSEGIAYGMLLMVYMSSTTADYKADFDKLWAYWKKYAVNGGTASGMKWHINNNNGQANAGTATDADIDAAVALVMAYKQWGQDSYLTDAKSLITWIKNNDMQTNGLIKPGSNWSDPFNTSYVSPAAFKLFAQVNTAEVTFWNNAINVNNNKVKACQDAATGLVPDWCDGSNRPVVSGAVTTGNPGLNYDAARTPWRLAQGYYWFGDTGSKEINDKLAAWLVPHTYGHASYIHPGYIYRNGAYDISGLSGSVQSAYMGVGFAVATVDNPGNYIETLYESLINTQGKTTPSATVGEKYFSATLNVIYLLLVTGNMPNFYDMAGYTNLVQGSLKAPTPPTGTQLTDPSASFASFSNWGAFSDKLGAGTVMYPDSGQSAIYLDPDGKTYLRASLRIAAEPEYGTPEASAGKYPFAGVALSFAEDERIFDLSDVKTIRVTLKTQGVIRFALTNTFTSDVLGEDGGEPGYWFEPSETFQTIDIDLSPDQYGYFAHLMVPPWATASVTPQDILPNVTGIKFEPKMSKGGFGSFEVAELLFLNAAGEPANIYEDSGNPAAISPKAKPIQNSQLKVAGSILHYQGFSASPILSVTSLKGDRIFTQQLSGTSGTLSLKELKLPQGIAVIRIHDTHHSAVTTTFLK
ncbi:MAG: hypothetical protein LBR60_07835 [Fibrobacter sp.]|nr:hypothetical protein [Fibrobacter sp.]